MRHVVFTAPFLLPSTLRFVRAVAKLPDVRVGLISHDHARKIPQDLRGPVTNHVRVSNCMDAGQLAIAGRQLMNEMGRIDRIFGALEELQVPLGRVRDYLGIEGMGGETAANFRDKSRMKDVLRANNVPCARHCLVTDPQQARDFINQVGFPVVVKPPAGAGARATFQVDNQGQLDDYLAAFDPDPKRPTLFEEFIQGEEYSFEGISINGERVWHSLTRYYPTPLEVLKNPWIQWCVLLPREVDHPRFDPIRKANLDALNALGMGTGLTHMEWFRRADGSVAVSEVGARPPGAQIMSLMSYATDADMYAKWAELMVYDRFEIPERKYASGACYLRGMGQGKVKTIHGLAQAQKEVGEIVVETSLPRPGQHSGKGYEGEGYVIVRHPDTEVVKKVLSRLVSLIRVEYN